MNPVDITFYVIVDPARSRRRPLPQLARIAADNGATLVQYRDKTAETGTMVANARAIRAALEGTGVPLIVNDRVDVALAAGAAGVHLGQTDMAPADARRIMGDDAIIGLSVRTGAQARATPAGLIDYAFIGGVFATASKDNPASIGVDGWRRIAAILRERAPGLPVGAIAGIDATNAGALVRAGADGLAVISAVAMADDPAAATRHLMAVIREARR
ncbi:MAG: thiamine-phosphate synthase [Alphaproteobacteria bacterium]|nr:MAG: thiamine-phosphate synthase [Alphaproteobacteria bacterium]